MNAIAPLSAPIAHPQVGSPPAEPTPASPLASKNISLPDKPLTRYLTTDPARAAVSWDRKAMLWNVAAKVSFFAFCAIAIVIATIGVIGPLGTGMASMLLLGAFCLSFIPFIFYQSFQKWSDRAHDFAAVEHGTADILKEMVEWKKEDVEVFFAKYNLSLDQLPLERLAKLSPDESLLALKPLIARFECYRREAAEYMAQAQHLIDTELKIAELHLQVIKQGFIKLEGEVLPAALRAAVTLHLLAQPAQELEISQVGRFDILSPGDRMLRRKVTKNDDYFIPANGPALQWKEAVSLTRAENYIALKQKLGL